jgi:hypothetical protein
MIVVVPPPNRQVKGVLFVDYVRMLRGYKDVDWSAYLPAEDLSYLMARIDPGAWYPMATFERMGNQILRVVARGDTSAVRMWGRLSVDQLRAAQPMLVAPGDPIETLNRFRVLRSTFFDFDALDVLMLYDETAQIEIHYHMGMPAEEAASMQTLGFFERLLEIAGASEIKAAFRSRSWIGDPRTVLALDWRLHRA